VRKELIEKNFGRIPIGERRGQPEEQRGGSRADSFSRGKIDVQIFREKGASEKKGPESMIMRR